MSDISPNLYQILDNPREYAVLNQIFPKEIGETKRKRNLEYDYEYNQRPESKARRKAYEKTEKGKAARRRYDQKPDRVRWYNQYAKSHLGRETQRRFRQTKERKEYMREYTKTREKTDESFRIGRRINRRLRCALERMAEGKICTSKEYGVDYKKIAEHLGQRPDKERVWVIDHIKPCCSFDLTRPDQVALCFAPQNLRWLTSRENSIKIAEDKKMSIHKKG